MADKRKLDSCTIVDVSSQSEKGKDYRRRKIKEGKEEGKKWFCNWILESPWFLLDKVVYWITPNFDIGGAKQVIEIYH